MTYKFQSRLGETDCTDLWVMKLTKQVSLSNGFRVPHWKALKQIDLCCNVIGLFSCLIEAEL